MPFVIMYWKQILYGAAALCVTFLLYWYGYHIPNKLKAIEEANRQLQGQVKAGEDALKLLDDIQKGKAKIDDNTFKQISSVRSKIGKPHTTLIPSGRLSMSPVR